MVEERAGWLHREAAWQEAVRLGQDERDFLLQVTKPWESGCRSGEVSLSHYPWVLCPAQFPLEGNPELY